MTLKIEVKQTRSVTPENKYRVKTEVEYANGIDASMFVFNTETQIYSHVAYPYDMLTYPNNRNDALIDGASYYRQTLAEVDYDALDTASAAATYTVERLDWLLVQYDEDVVDFVD